MTDGLLPADSCCDDFSSATSRRNALRMALGLTGGLAAASVFGSAFVETAYAATGKADRMLVVLSMRGAADGMSLVVPHGDPIYYSARPSIAVPKASLLAVDPFFGLHPSLKPLLPLWNAGKIAAVHATGQIVTTRSHFAAMEEVEDADPGSGARVGWLNRLLSLNTASPSYLGGIQLGSVVQNTQLAGPTPSLAANGLNSLKMSGPEGDWQAGWETGLKSLWAANSSEVTAGGQAAIALAKTFAPVLASAASPTVYPKGDLAEALQATARILKADVGAEVITVDQGSWDHHQWVGNLNDGNLKRMADPFASSLAAFFEDLGPLADRVTVVTLSEFGRRVKENANGGLDHGHGNVMFTMGAGVKGGYYGRWPGIENSQDADLPVTTDYRDVLSEVVGRLYPDRSLATIFPQFAPTAIGFMTGVIAPPPTDPPPTDPPVTPPPTTPPAPKAMPSSFFLSFGTKKGSGRIRTYAYAPIPKLSAAGKRAGVSVSFQWELVYGGKTTIMGRGTKLWLKKAWLKRTLHVRVTYKAKGYKNLVKVFSWGRIHR